MLDFDHTRRPSAQAILEDHWIKATIQDAVNEPMDHEVIIGIRISHFRRVCLNMLAWSLTAKDAKELQRSFAHFDVNGAGMLSVNEFRSVLEDNFSIHSVEAAQIFANIQQEDNPGEICYNDFLAEVMRKRFRIHQKSLCLLWNKLSDSDGNSDSTIAIGTLRSVLGGDDFDAGEVEALIRELHPTSAGEISFQEFMSSLETSPRSDLADVDEERQRKFIEMAVTLIDNELAGIASDVETWPKKTRPASTPTTRSFPHPRCAQQVPKRHISTPAATPTATPTASFGMDT